MNEDRELLLSFILSLTMNDNMSDVAMNIMLVLERLNISIDWDDLNDLEVKLTEMGIKNLQGI